MPECPCPALLHRYTYPGQVWPTDGLTGWVGRSPQASPPHARRLAGTMEDSRLGLPPPQQAFRYPGFSLTADLRPFSL